MMKVIQGRWIEIHQRLQLVFWFYGLWTSRNRPLGDLTSVLLSSGWILVSLLPTLWTVLVMREKHLDVFAYCFHIWSTFGLRSAFAALSQVRLKCNREKKKLQSFLAAFTQIWDWRHGPFYDVGTKTVLLSLPVQKQPVANHADALRPCQSGVGGWVVKRVQNKTSAHYNFTYKALESSAALGF